MMGQLSSHTRGEITWGQLTASDFHFPPKPEDCWEDMEPPVKLGPDGSYPGLVPGLTKLI